MSALQAISQEARKEVWVSAISNTIFNGLIAWLLLKAGPDLTLAGDKGFAVDMIATAFILPFIVTLIVVPLNRRKRSRGELPALPLNPGHWLDRLVAPLPQGLLAQALIAGAACMVLYAPTCILALWVCGIESFTPLAYSLFKGLWAGVLAALLTPLLLLLALREKTP